MGKGEEERGLLFFMTSFVALFDIVDYVHVEL